jgi:hypothetical protein
MSRIKRAMIRPYLNLYEASSPAPDYIALDPFRALAENSFMIVRPGNSVIILEFNMTPKLSSPERRPMRHIDILCLFLGLVGAALWSYRNFTLPDYGRGLMCGDAAEYIRLTETTLSAVFEHSSVRVFGYPFFLAALRPVAPADGLLLLTLLVQVSLHIASSFFLFFALRRTGLIIPYAVLGLLWAHPALIGVNSLTLTDGIATSFTSLMLGTVILLLNNKSYLPIKGTVIGLIFGITISLRPSISTSMWLFIFLVAVALYSSERSLGSSFKKSAQRGVAFLFFYAIGFAPIYGHIVNNCYRASGEFCVISSYHVAEWVPVSFRKAIEYGRIWGIVRPGGVFEWGFTDDRVLQHCDVGREHTTAQLLSCYRQNFTNVPRHFFRRTIGIFDNRHLNPYAALLTSPAEYWTLRIFSLVGLVGVFAASLHFAIGLAKGTWPRIAYLTFPLLYLAIQLNFHGETRYIFPIQPILFFLALYSLRVSAFPKRWLYALYLVGSSVLATIFITMVTHWDSMP